MIEINKKSSPTALGGYIMAIDKQELQSSDIFEVKKGAWFAMIHAPLDSRQLFPFRLRDIENTVSQIIASLDEQVDRWLRLTSATLVFEVLPDESSYEKNAFSLSHLISIIGPVLSVRQLTSTHLEQLQKTANSRMT